MTQPKHLLVLLLAVTFFSCNNNRKYPYAIGDFRKELQPHLTRILETGVVMYGDSALEHMATEEELKDLGLSENPILRATAFQEMLDRKSFNHFDVLMGHLDDTALVFMAAGEFGIWDLTVSDFILQEARWKTKEAKNKTVEQVLTKHNYLRSAYIVLTNLEPQEKYYTYIKDMATRPRRLDPDGYELNFDDIEYALYGLAKYRKKEDVKIIKGKLKRYVGWLSDKSFRLMKEFPDTAYFEVLQTYHRIYFYRFSGNRPHGFTGGSADKAAPEDFINALVVQQTEKSAKLLDTMLTTLPKYTCFPDKESIIDQIVNAIGEHPCPAYANLRKKIRPRAEELMKWQLSFPVDPPIEHIDTTKEKIRWYH